MIIKKPYAFLIKNFRKIHIFLILIGIYVFIRTLGVIGFVNDFMQVGTYNVLADPITKHITTFMNIGIFIMIVGSVALLFLLMHKEKPWKIYLIPVITYILLFLVLGMVKGFFNTYQDNIAVTNIRLSRDFLMIFMFGQIPSLAIFGMRVFGWDIKKFDFNSDLDTLDLSEEDREEIEVSLNFDINTIKRTYRRVVRNIGYFYKEHTKICRAIIAILAIILIYNAYIFIFVTHKTYKQGQPYNVSGYTFVVGDAYFTDKDVNGDVISKDSNFVIVKIKATNNEEARNLDTSNFHIRAGRKSYGGTDITYEKEFSDIGKCYKKVTEIKKDESLEFIIVYKVDKKISKNRFDLYYQEQWGIYKSRKIQLKIKDISKVSKPKKLKLGEYFDVLLAGKEESLSIENYKLTPSTTVYFNICSAIDECDLYEDDYSAPKDHLFMEMYFSSDSYEAKNMIDFLKKYGRINYKDSKGKKHTQEVVNGIPKTYLGKVVYLKVPKEFDYYEDVELHITVRDKEYYYQLT